MARRARVLVPSVLLLAGSAAILAGVAVTGSSRPARAENNPAPPAAKPLETPLAKPDPWDDPVGPLADNSACLACHGNYREEELVALHAKSNVGCVKCHGESLAHRNDENHAAPPDKMYPAASIDKACADCHDYHDASARTVLTRWRERCSEKTDPATVVCTDCHGQHRLAHRTVRWNKETRGLIPGATPPAAPMP